MRVLQHLFDSNQAWSERVRRDNPQFFERLSPQQSPRYLWIGCADSRVPANEITGLDPGEVFVHRNVANLVVHSDLNALSTIQFAVEHLLVEHIMVVGHHGCAGVRAALRGTRVGLADNWLRHLQDVRLRHRKRLEHLPPAEQEDALCEMNVIEQVGNVALSTVLQDAWARGQTVAVHGWVYGLRDGLLGVHEVGTVIQHDFDDAGVFEVLGIHFGAPIGLGDGPTRATGDRFVAGGPLRQRLAAPRGVGRKEVEHHPAKRHYLQESHYHGRNWAFLWAYEKGRAA